MKKALTVDIITSLYAMLFLYTGISKIIGHELFALSLTKSPVLHPYVGILSIAVPALEVAIALAIFSSFFVHAPRARAWGLYSGVVLMAMFTGYVWYILRTIPHSLPCSCGGIIQQMNWHQHLYFNTAFTILGILACWLNNRLPKESSHNPAFS